MKPIRIFIAGLCACASLAQAAVVQLDLTPLYNLDGVANTGAGSKTKCNTLLQGAAMPKIYTH